MVSFTDIRAAFIRGVQVAINSARPKLQTLNALDLKGVYRFPRWGKGCITGAVEPLDIFPIERDHTFQPVIFEVTIKVGMVGDNMWKVMFERIPQAKQPHIKRRGDMQQIGLKGLQLLMSVCSVW